jgi:hypothetical protein
MLNLEAQELQTDSQDTVVRPFLLHCGLLSFGCQGNRLNLFVLLSFCAGYAPLPHFCPLVPTHYFVISWIPKQNIGEFVEYIKETNKVFKYTTIAKNTTVWSTTVVTSEHDACLQNCKSYDIFVIIFIIRRNFQMTSNYYAFFARCA